MSNSATKFKETEIGLIPEEWEFFELEKVAKSIIDYRGKTPRKTDSGVPLITAKVVKDGRIDFSNSEYIAEEDYDLWMRRGLPKAGEVVITTEAPLGEVAQLPDFKIALAQRIITISGKDDCLDDTFLKYYFLSNVGNAQLKTRETGSVVTGIRQSELRKVKVLMPPIDEQKQIAEILSSLDEKIELNRKINANLEKLADSLFKKWFVDIGDELPEGWRMGSITDVCVFNPPYKIQKGKISKYVEMKNLPEDGSSIRNFMERPFTSGSKFINGDTLLARITPCLENGKTGFVDFLDNSEIAWGSTEFIVMHPVKEEYSEFLYILARLNDFRECAIQSMSGTSGRQRVQILSLQNYELTIPDNKTISRFHSIMVGLFLQMEFNNKQSAILSQMRDSLLPRLMSGKIRVKI